MFPPNINLGIYWVVISDYDRRKGMKDRMQADSVILPLKVWWILIGLMNVSFSYEIIIIRTDSKNDKENIIKKSLNMLYLSVFVDVMLC